MVGALSAHTGLAEHRIARGGLSSLRRDSPISDFADYDLFIKSSWASLCSSLIASVTLLPPSCVCGRHWLLWVGVSHQNNPPSEGLIMPFNWRVLIKCVLLTACSPFLCLRLLSFNKKFFTYYSFDYIHHKLTHILRCNFHFKFHPVVSVIVCCSILI